MIKVKTINLMKERGKNMGITKCELYVDDLAVTKLNINSKQSELFCFKPKFVYNDDLGMTSSGKLVIPADGNYRLTASGVISDGGANDYIRFGFDLGTYSEMQQGTRNGGDYEKYSLTSIECDRTGNSDYKYGCISDVAYLTAGTIIGCVYLRASQNTENIKARCPLMSIEKIG